MTPRSPDPMPTPPSSRPLFSPYPSKPWHGVSDEGQFDSVPLPTTAAAPRSPAVKHVIRLGDTWLTTVKLVSGQITAVCGKRPDAIRYPSAESATKVVQRLASIGGTWTIEPAAK